MRRATLTVLAVLATALLATGCGDDSADDSSTTAEFNVRTPIGIFAPTSLDVPFGAYTRGSNLTTNISYTGSDQAAQTIRNGEPPDLYVADNTDLTDQLFDDGLIAEPVPIATDELVLAVPTDSKIDSVDDLTDKGVRIAIGRESLPAGQYTTAALSKLPVAEQKAIAANVSTAEANNNGIVLALTKDDEADAGFVYASDVRANAGELKAIELPPDLQQEVVYTAAVPGGAKNPAGGQHFLDQMLNGAGADELQKAGFGPPPAG